MLPQIFVYGDSMSWGIVPMTRKRFPFESRWPGVMQIALSEEGLPVHVIEDCLNGRRTVWEDPFKAGRNGLTGLTQRIEVNSPLALAIIMLGTNDFQSMHPHNAWHSAQGVGVLVKAIREAPIEPGMPVPPILVVAPPPTHNPQGPLAPKFKDAEPRSAAKRKIRELRARSARFRRPSFGIKTEGIRKVTHIVVHDVLADDHDRPCGDGVRSDLVIIESPAAHDPCRRVQAHSFRNHHLRVAQSREIIDRGNASAEDGIQFIVKFSFDVWIFR